MVNYFKSTIVIIAAAIVISCNPDNDVITNNGTTDTNTETVDQEQFTTSVSEAMLANKNCHGNDTDYDYDLMSVVNIALADNNIVVNGDGATVNSNIVTINSGGTYSISGTLTNGQIIVNTDKAVVKLIFNNVSITNTVSAAIYVVSAKRTIFYLPANTNNYFTDAQEYIYDSVGADEPNATIFSNDNITFYGAGNITIKGNYNDAINSNDGLLIKSGNMFINAVDDGIRGKDYVVAETGYLSIVSGGDGIKSDNSADSTRGYIFINDAQIDVTSGGDAISAQTDFLVLNANINIKAGGGSSASVNSNISTKGIKAGVNLIIENGTFNINSSDDALHTNGNLIIGDGNYTLLSNDDGIHADILLTVNYGNINITKSYEGIESKTININSGTINLVSSDDGINAASGATTTGGGGWGMPMSAGDSYFTVNGGTLYINAGGDGVDANGAIVMTGGTLLVSGPTNNGNAALDYDTSFKLDGGLFVAAGSSGMAMAPSTSSVQNSVLVNFNSAQAAGTLFHVCNTEGENVLTFMPEKKYQSVAFSSPLLISGATYNIYTGGSHSGVLSGQLYTNGVYTGGTKYSSFTISSVVTKLGATGGMGH